jgi:hypothetical protein
MEKRRQNKEELHAVYTSPHIIRLIKSRRMKWVGHVARMGERRVAYRVFIGKPKGRRLFERPRQRWEDITLMELREVGRGHELDRTGSGWGQIAGYCECGNGN